jgi:predicted N-acetyltransferase YhbS
LDWDLIDNIYALFNPAASLLRALSYGNSDEIYFDKTYEEPKECWMLTHLSVDPECQKHGIGLRLCQWGLEYAKEEELPATLCSTIDGKRLYQKAGFRAIGSWQWAEGNDRTMSIMRVGFARQEG